MKYWFIIILLTSVVLSGCNEQKLSIEAAEQAYNDFDLEKSEKILNRILEHDTTDVELKCDALRRLSLIKWKFYKNYQSAYRLLLKADSLGESKYKAWALATRISRENENFDDALDANQKMLKYAVSESQRQEAVIENSKVIYESAIKEIKDGRNPDTVKLHKSANRLLNILNTDAVSHEQSKLLLGISLLLDDYEKLITAWMSYFHFHDTSEVYPYLQQAYRTLIEVKTKYENSNSSIDTKETLIKALGLSRLYEYIPAVTYNKNIDYNQEVTDLIVYSQYLDTVKKVTNEYYRQIATNEADEKEYKQWLSNVRKELWKQVSCFNKSEYDEKKFMNETEKHFGAKGFSGGTANFSGFVLCLGHIVDREKVVIEQYGYTPDLTYTQIDMMTSNGYSSWFWENQASGGWATDDEIIRVREVYLSQPYKNWVSLNDTIIRNGILNEIKLLMSGHHNMDQTSLAGKLEAKLNFDANTELYDSLFDLGLRSNNLKLAFLRTYSKRREEATIFAHEGRHSIDKRYFPEEFAKMTNAEREYRAKLSQLIFATEPRYELAGMVSSIGDSGHGLANKMIVEDIIEWINQNNESIPGYSANRSAFEQIFLLSANQIKECCKKAEPLITY